MFTFFSSKLGQRHASRKGLLQVITATVSTYFRFQAFCILSWTVKLFQAVCFSHSLDSCGVYANEGITHSSIDYYKQIMVEVMAAMSHQLYC